MVVKGLIGLKLAWMWIWCSSMDRPRAYVLLILDHNELYYLAMGMKLLKVHIQHSLIQCSGENTAKRNEHTTPHMHIFLPYLELSLDVLSALPLTYHALLLKEYSIIILVILVI